MKMDWWNRVDSWRFWLGTEIRFGPSIRNELARLAASAGKRIFLAGYASPSPLDSVYETLVEQLKKEGFDVQVFFRVTGEPASSLAIEGYELASRIAPEVILGVGGGSVLDTAKAIAYQIRTGISLDRVLGCKAGRNSPPADLEVDSDPPGMPVRLILMPTTPGSGSEVSEVAVLGGEFSSGDVPGPIPVKWVLSSSRVTGRCRDPRPRGCENLS
jgi:alcohol dehydrogenase class IV